jgi:hypothetical protein
VAVNGESGSEPATRTAARPSLRLTKYPYENAIQDVTSGLEVRERQFAVLDLKANPPPVAPSTFAGAKVEKLVDGFYSLGGGAVDAAGTLYFADRKHQRIYSWSDARKLSIVRDNTLDPSTWRSTPRATCWCCRRTAATARSTASSRAVPTPRSR